MANKICPFCAIPEEECSGLNEHAAAFRDEYPLAEGHTLVIPKRHVASIFDLSNEEYRDLWELTRAMRVEISGEQNPAGFNIGINDGAAAGQTVSHAHIHIIPRHDGDVPDPRGGIRWVLPEKAVYWAD